MDNKRVIIYYLFQALKATRAFADLIDLDYVEEQERVVAHFKGGARREIDVNGCSGWAMIKTVSNKMGG